MPGETVELAAGFPVSGADQGPFADGVELMELVGGRAAVGRYLGGYEGLGDGWAQIKLRRAEQDEQTRGDFWEIYEKQAASDGDQSTNETLLVLPLA